MVILNERSKLKQFLTESLGAEDPVSLFGHSLKPVIVLHARVDTEDVLKKVVFTELLNFLLE